MGEYGGAWGGFNTILCRENGAQNVDRIGAITLLCFGYKLISGIVSNRLEKYLHKVSGRAQKGFLKTKNINTCTVNGMNSISRAWTCGIPTGILCVDFAKTFNSVGHEIIGSVVEFFGYKQTMKIMVMTLLNNHKSRIISGNGYSGNISIGRGTPQGDRLSPYIFIMCIEILLIKIQLKVEEV